LRAELIDGKKIADAMRAELEPEVKALKTAGTVPGLAVVLVGENPASQVYVRMKGKACEQLGMHSETIRLAAETREDELLAVIARLNADPAIHGCCAAAAPAVYQRDRAARHPPGKDVDGFHPENVGKVSIGDRLASPATPYGVQRSGPRRRGDAAHVVIVGRSNIVGRPMASLLLLGAWRTRP
jgi:methylenetetrahydrofolate dehydrogenase (NADP+)/methenyltetrahydrofolate cyclohydrolase